MLGDENDGVIQYAQTEEQKKAIQNIIDLYQRKINGEDIKTKEWKNTADAAAAREKKFKKIADKLLELLKNSKL